MIDDTGFNGPTYSMLKKQVALLTAKLAEKLPCGYFCGESDCPVCGESLLKVGS